MPSNRKRQGWVGEPLPRGRHGLSTQAVRSSQRERLIRAMMDLVAAQGYAATTVPQVVATARVSRNAFYEFFADKEDCFLALCEEDATGLLQELRHFATEADWVQALRKGVPVYLRWWQDRPELSRAYFVEMPAVGERAWRQRNRAYALFDALFADIGRRARKQQPALEPLNPAIPRLIVLGVTEYVAGEIRAGRGNQLEALAGPLLFYIVKLLADDATARRMEPPKRRRIAG
jgi:AcrR family transcriptional regulator